MLRVHLLINVSETAAKDLTAEDQQGPIQGTVNCSLSKQCYNKGSVFVYYRYRREYTRL